MMNGYHVLSGDLKNRIEQQLRDVRGDINFKARAATGMLEGAFVATFGPDTRAKVEEIFAHGVTPEHLEKAVALVADRAERDLLDD